MEPFTARIGDLITGVDKPVYQRSNGDTHLKLTKEYHVKVIQKEVKGELKWVGDGLAELLDPNEEVVVIEYETQPPKEKKWFNFFQH